MLYTSRTIMARPSILCCFFLFYTVSYVTAARTPPSPEVAAALATPNATTKAAWASVLAASLLASNKGRSLDPLSHEDLLHINGTRYKSVDASILS